MKRTKLISVSVFGVLFLVLTIFCFAPRISYADAPEDVKIAYDAGTQTLAVTITHKTSIGFHYIKKVEINKNSVGVSTINYDKQPKEVPFTYTYKVKASQGDKLEVTVTCSLSGSKTAILTVSTTAK
jgi:hypothetical protein